MARCSYHPAVDTDIACAECGRPICPRDMVDTPVGYKCPDCARPLRSQYTYIKPRQIAGAVAFGLAVGVGGGLVIGAIGFGFILLSFGWGMLTGEAVRRGSGGHRGTALTVIASVCLGIGGLFGGLGALGIAAGIVGAAVTLGWTWGR